MNVPETFFSVREELMLFGLSCLAGVLIGAAYNILRVLRIVLPHNSWLTAIEDAAFVILYGVFILSFASAAARGQLRAYFVIGNLLGAVLYHFTIGSFVTALMRRLTELFVRSVQAVLRPLRHLFAFISKKAMGKFVGYSKNSVNSFKKIKMLLLKPCLVLYNKKENIKKRIVRRVAKKTTRNNKCKGQGSVQ